MSHNSDQAIKLCSRVALIALGVLLVGAVILYKERTLFADAAYITFNIINYNSLSIQEHRYGSAITQLIPYLAQRANFPLKYILLAYSASFYVFFLCVAGLLAWLKQYRLAIIMCLYYFLLISASYFWQNNELLQASAWMFLALGVTIYLGYHNTNIFLLAAVFLTLTFLAIFTHYIVIIPLAFLMIYFIIEGMHWPFSKKVSLVLGGLVVAVIAAKFLSSTEHSYDDSHLHGATHFSLQDIIDSFSTPVVQMFFYRCLVNYWIAVVVFIAGVGTLIKAKQKSLAIWSLLSCLGYIILMGLTYAKEDKNVALFHIETEWAAIGIIIGTPFVFAFLPAVKPSVAMIALAIVFATRLIYIGAAIPSFTWRTHFRKEVLVQMKKKGITKLAIYNDNPLRATYILDWALTYESMFASIIDGNKPVRTFFFVNKDNKQTLEMVTTSKGFYDVWDMILPGNLNSQYFVIDTSRSYQVMTYQELFQ